MALEHSTKFAIEMQKKGKLIYLKKSSIQKVRSWMDRERRGWGTEESGLIQSPDGTGLLAVSAYEHSNDLMISLGELYKVFCFWKCLHKR